MKCKRCGNHKDSDKWWDLCFPCLRADMNARFDKDGSFMHPEGEDAEVPLPRVARARKPTGPASRENS